MAAQGSNNITIVLDSDGNLLTVSQAGEEWASYELRAGDEAILLTQTTVDAPRISSDCVNGYECKRDPATGRTVCKCRP
jgi:hypothetical protein